MPSIDLNNLLSQLEQLRHRPGFDPEDKALMMQYEIEVSHYEALLVLKDNPVFLGLIDTFEKQIKFINDWLLANSKDMLMNPDKAREALYLTARREVYAEFVDHFKSDPKQLIERIQARVDHFIKK